MNLYGPKGSGKSTFICHFLNEMKKRNIYSDGEYFIRFAELGQHQDSVKILLKKHFGEKFDNNMNEYFKGTKKLIIIDDFNKILNITKYVYPNFFLRALRVNNIHAVFVTRQKMPAMEEVESCVSWQLAQLTKKQLLSYILTTNARSIFNVNADISSLEHSKMIENASKDSCLIEANIHDVLSLLNINVKQHREPDRVEIFEESDDDEIDPPNLRRREEFEIDNDYISFESYPSERKNRQKRTPKHSKKYKSHHHHHHHH